MLSFEEFKNFYQEKKRLPEIIIYNKEKLLNEEQLKGKYKKYCKIITNKEIKLKKDFEKYKLKSIIKIDNRWNNLKKELIKRDNNKCRLIDILSDKEYQELKENDLCKFRKILDMAHIISRSNNIKLKYNIDNVILLNRYSHSCLDKFCNPINGKQITKDEYETWWIRIIGKDLYFKLKDKE
jgi:flagella basal body P-ring formation protein FlgA